MCLICVCHEWCGLRLGRRMRTCRSWIGTRQQRSTEASMKRMVMAVSILSVLLRAAGSAALATGVLGGGSHRGPDATTGTSPGAAAQHGDTVGRCPRNPLCDYM